MLHHRQLYAIPSLWARCTALLWAFDAHTTAASLRAADVRAARARAAAAAQRTRPWREPTSAATGAVRAGWRA